MADDAERVAQVILVKARLYEQFGDRQVDAAFVASDLRVNLLRELMSIVAPYSTPKDPR